MRTSYLLLLIVFIGCQSKEPLQKVTITPISTIFQKLLPEQTGINFSNELTITEEFDVFRYRNYYNGGGVAIGDINNDLLPDIYITSNMGSNKLFLNKGGLKFQDITDKAGVAGTKIWSTGVTMVDVNADGFLDIYVCNSGDLKGNHRENELFINNGNSTFTEKAHEVGLDDNGFSTHAVFFDYDKDGDLDCYVLNNSFRPISTLGYRNLRDQRDQDGGDKLYKNYDGHFYDVSSSAGIYGSVIGFGLGVTVGDVNQDNWLDIYISNDFYERDYLYINNQDGTFREELEKSMGHISMFSMGADLADINNDGYPDIFSTDMLPSENYRLKTLSDFESYDIYQLRLKNGYYHQFMRNMLHLNNKDGTFSEIGQLARVDASDWSWGALIADLNNDCSKEIFVCNGIYKDVTDQDFVNFLGASENMKRAMEGKKIDFQEFVNKMTSTKLSNCLFVNQGDWQFEDKAASWGLDEPSFSNGAAYGDLDNDGDLDLLVNNVNQDLFFYQNLTSDKKLGNSISISFKGLGKNSFGLGAKVKTYVDNKILYSENIPTRGFQSSMDYKMIIGIGANKQADSVEVLWQSGNYQVIKNVLSGTSIVLEESSSRPRLKEAVHSIKPLFVDASYNSISHVENQYNDFDHERLLYHMLSTQGPAFTKADINKDGLDDFFIGGAKGRPGSIFLQTNNMMFKKISSKVFDADSLSEDIDAKFFDADSDGDLDLYVVSGGVENLPQSAQMLDRLYINQFNKTGILDYVKAEDQLPAIYKSGSCVRPHDYDNDGDMDLFLGTRSRVNYYGMPCDQFLLQNDGHGKFKDVTIENGKELRELGMVSDAQWFDYNKDGFSDLLIIGEWMPISLFLNDGKNLTKSSSVNGLDSTDGWWNRMQIADLDNDGDMDFVLGNLGENSKFRPTKESPITLYVNDFDQNGSTDPIYSFLDEGKEYPFALRQDIIKQMSGLKKQFIYFKDYANKPLRDFLSKDLIAGAYTYKFFEPHSSILINEGAAGFKLKHLPIQAQFSPVYGILIEDINKDANLDIVLGGNIFSVKPEEGRYDASRGLVLLGDGKNNFTPLSSLESGINIDGEIRWIFKLNGKGNYRLAFVRNNNTTVFYKLQK